MRLVVVGLDCDVLPLLAPLVQVRPLHAHLHVIAARSSVFATLVVVGHAEFLALDGERIAGRSQL